jgi:ParB/RepB/Spo0J family partition protein
MKMKIPLNEIKPSPNPIRKTWDEEKMKELTESLQTEGQVEPIGVRGNGKPDEYIIVWGHRRAEAARRANWDEIDCVIVPKDEIDNLIQAGIENLSSEDMNTDDKAEWANKLIEMGMRVVDISKRTSVSANTISKWLVYREEKCHGIFLNTDKRKGDSDYRKVFEISQTLKSDLPAKKAIAEKVSSEDLSTLQTRAVAEAYRDAPTPAVKEAVLKAPIISRDTAADILRRSVARVEMDTGHKVMQDLNEWQKEKEEYRTVQDYDLAVKSYIDATKLYRQENQKVPSHIKYNKYSPEAARYVVRLLRSLVDDLKTNIELLDGVK